MLSLRHVRAMRGIWRHLDRVAKGKHPLYVDLPSRPDRRWGWGRPAHPELDALVCAGKASCAALLAELEAHVADGVRSIPVSPGGDPHSPHWHNGYIGSLDGVTLYGLPSLFGARRYVEIGSGHSTRFVRRGALDQGRTLHITSIDPDPREEIDDLCDVVVRRTLEEASLEVFEALDANDVLMCDGSHRCLTNSDVTVLFLEILPRLRPGVIVYLDDIYLPHDYPAEWDQRCYSEQYLLAALLLGDGGRRYEVLFPGHLTTVDPDLGALADRFWQRAAVPDLTLLPANGFWMRVRG